MIDLNELAINAYDTARKREKNGANNKTDIRSMLKHCATEVVEAMEAYAKAEEHYEHCGFSYTYSTDFVGELADIITCVLIICGGGNIDIEAALEECQKKNKARANRQGDKL